jgi:hypothetical protein
LLASRRWPSITNWRTGPEGGVFVLVATAPGGFLEQGSCFRGPPVRAINAVKHLVGLDATGIRFQGLARIALGRLEFAKTDDVNAGNAQGERCRLGVELECVLQDGKSLGNLFALQVHTGDFLGQGDVGRIQVQGSTVVAERLVRIVLGHDHPRRHAGHGFGPAIRRLLQNRGTGF